MKYLTLLKDWFWFLFILKANESSGKICLDMKYIDKQTTPQARMEAMENDSYRVVRLRNKAHDMDIRWIEFKKRYFSYY